MKYKSKPPEGSGLREEIAFFHLRPLPLLTPPSGGSDPPWGLHKEEMKRKKSSSYFAILTHPPMALVGSGLGFFPPSFSPVATFVVSSDVKY